MNFQFKWDEAKAVKNVRKHKVRFEEAITVFGDPRSITIFDAAHSETEDRFIDIGLSENGRVLIVTYTERDAHIRIVSCRKAEPPERRQYEQ